MSYSDFISINKNFQASVNLELDLEKESKVNEYVPTTDICDVIKKYVKTALGETKDFATTLVGPYGKGKSFLLLILTFLLGKNKNSAAWIQLVEKIRKVDTQLYELLLEVKRKNITLLPILINSNYDNVAQSFQLALNDSLKREKLDFIIPSSIFDVCLDLLEKWNSRENIRENVLKQYLNSNALSLGELKAGLKNYSPTAYKHFKELYNRVNVGLEFNPLINHDVVKTYRTILPALNEHGFTGIFIIFDEFSKFLESSSSDLMKDLKIIQDFAEQASRSDKKSQMHLCCVTHKSIGLYKKDQKRSNVSDSFKTVEGRFKEIRFNRSLNENYQLISSAFTKKNNYFSQIAEFVKNHNEFVNKMSNLDIFNNDSLRKIIFDECFPLNPLTVYCLIQICELSAQNERTLFTFLSDTDDDSFNSFLHSKSDGLFDVDKIYDYFCPLFKKAEEENIKTICYGTESLLSKLDDPNEKRIVKTLAIILIINNPNELKPTSETISLATELSLEEVNKKISSMIGDHHLRKGDVTGYLFLASSSSKQIDDGINVLKKTKCQNIKLGEIADEINEKKYILPRKYNEENKITRFFRIAFFTEEDFLKVTSFNYYFEQNYCDGLVVYLLSDKLNAEDVQNKVASLKDSRVVVKIPREPIDDVFYKLLIDFACLKEYKKQKDLDDMVLAQVGLIMRENQNDIQNFINEYYETSFTYFSSIYGNKGPFNEALSDIMDSIYYKKLIFNNELMNKKDVTTQYQKAVNHVIDWLLNGQKDFPYSETSPESSIKFAFLDYNQQENESSKNFRVVIEDLKKKLIGLEGKKITIKDVVQFLSKAPYGVKDGIVPILFAKAISESSDNAIIYYQQKEVELNSFNIVKAVKNDKYQISFAKGSSGQKEYLEKMLLLFDVKKENNFRRDTLLLSQGIKKFFIGLPQIIRLCSISNNYLSLDERFLSYKALFTTFDLNPYEVVFEKPLSLFKKKNYLEIYEEIKKIVDDKDVFLFDYYHRLISMIRNLFDIDEKSSLKSGFSDFIKQKIHNGEKPILEEENKKIFNAVTLDFTYDDKECVDKISKILTGQHIEDWDNDKSNVLKGKMEKFKNALDSSKKISDSASSLENLIQEPKEITGMSSLLKNNIESILDEFSGSVSTEEKANVLLSLLKKII